MFKKLYDIDEIICTGGIDYVYIRYNGDVFKCNAHNFSYNDDLKIFDINHELNENLLNINPICNCRTCNPQCDGLNTQQWINGKRVSNSSFCYPCRYVNEFKDLNRSHYSVILDIVNGCINNCIYCDNTVNNRHKIEFMNIEKCINFLKFINYHKKGEKHAVVCGMGEPLYHPNFYEFFNQIIELHFYTTIVSSLINVDLDKFADNFNKIKLNNENLLAFISFNISYHPTSPLFDHDNFIKNIETLLKNKIVINHINFVDHDENKKYLNLIETFCSSKSINLIKLNYNVIKKL